MDPDEVVERWTDGEFADEAGFADRWRSFAADADDEEETDSGPERAVPSPRTEDDRERPRDLAVVERDLPDGLFGFTRRDSDHVVVNRRLYRVDRDRTVQHERTHHLHPKDELTVRYINGDLDVENTLSFSANTPARMGRGTARADLRPDVAGYAAATQSYAEPYG